jgi:hypothetical protein
VGQVDVDEGLPIAYEVLEKGVSVFDSGGERVGSVSYVLQAPHEDIFHGIVVDVDGGGARTVLAEDVAAIHERGVDLRIDGDVVRSLPGPEGGAPVYDEDPTEMKGWDHWMHKLTLKGDWKRER